MTRLSPSLFGLAGAFLLAALPSAMPARPAVYRHDGAVLLPDSVATPGVVADTSTARVCRQHTATVRDVTSAMKRQVYLAYGVTDHRGICGGSEGCEVDHLISLELGGANDVRNLWPEPYGQHPGAHEKDQLENRLHRLVCAGALTLHEAQRRIAADWYRAYQSLGLDR